MRVRGWALVVVLALPSGGPARAGGEMADSAAADEAGGASVAVQPPLAGRARFMACGYVAPVLSDPTFDFDAGTGADAAFTRMLERLRQFLHSSSEKP